MSRSKVLVAAVCAAIALPTQAASDEALAACRAIRDATARLARYDALPGPAAPSPIPPARPPAGASPTMPPAAATPAPRPAESESTRFGLPATTQPTPLEFVESRIEGHFSGWY